MYYKEIILKGTEHSWLSLISSNFLISWMGAYLPFGGSVVLDPELALLMTLGLHLLP